MDCDIRLENCIFGFYKPEDEVVGTVVLRSAQQITRLGKITLSALGNGYIQWTEKHGDSKVVYKRSETYLSSDLKLASGRPGEPLDMPAGTHSFQFGFTLPKDIPQSAEITSDPGTYGYVRYLLRVVVELEDSREKSKVFELPLYVCGCLDLSKFSFALKPIEYRNKLGAANCCTLNNLAMYLKLHRTAYNPGEDIIIDGEFTNGTADSVRGLQFSLCEKVVFVAYDKLVGSVVLTNTLQNVLSSVTRGEVKPGCRDVFRNMALEIPWTAVPQLVGCNIIELQYTVRVVVITATGKSRQILTIPIVVGVIPAAAAALAQGLSRAAVAASSIATNTESMAHAHPASRHHEHLPLLAEASA